MKRILLFFISCYPAIISLSQTGSIGIGTSTPDNSALVDMQSVNKGMLPPRMGWQQVQAINNPAAGLIVFDTDIKALRLFNGTKWVVLSEGEDHLGDGPGHFYELPYTLSVDCRAAVNAIATGPNKTVYIGGGFTGGTFTMGAFSITNPSVLWSDIFFAKLDSLGNVIWLKTLGSNNGMSNSSDAIADLKVDASGNIYACGSFSMTLDFDPGPAVRNHTDGGVWHAGFYAKYDNDGNWVWSKQLTGPTTIVDATSLYTDGTSLYVTGNFTGNVEFNPYNSGSVGGDDIFLCRYQCSDGVMGVTGWMNRIGSTGDERAGRITNYFLGLMICGGFSGVCDFDGLSRTSAGSVDGFVANYGQTGAILNVNQIGGTGYDIIKDVKTTNLGEVYCAGSFSGTADFLPGSGVSNNLSDGLSDGFVIKYDAGFSIDGFAQLRNAEPSDFSDLVVGANGEVYALGQFTGEASINSLTFSSYNSSTSDMLLVKLSPYIYTEWAQQAGGLTSDSPRKLIRLPNSNTLMISGAVSTPYLDFNRKKHTGMFFLSWYYE